MLNQPLLDRLEALTTNMDVPLQRRTDVRWLMRNIAINNSDHPSLEEVRNICRILSKH